MLDTERSRAAAVLQSESIRPPKTWRLTRQTTSTDPTWPVGLRWCGSHQNPYPTSVGYRVFVSVDGQIRRVEVDAAIFVAFGCWFHGRRVISYSVRVAEVFVGLVLFRSRYFYWPFVAMRTSLIIMSAAMREEIGGGFVVCPHNFVLSHTLAEWRRRAQLNCWIAPAETDYGWEVASHECGIRSSFDHFFLCTWMSAMLLTAQVSIYWTQNYWMLHSSVRFNRVKCFFLCILPGVTIYVL